MNERVGPFPLSPADRARLDENSRLRISFKYSKDGTPAFACSRKPKEWYARRVPGDLLWADRAFNYNGNKAAFWERVATRAEEDRRRWATVQDDMARFTSLVEVTGKPGEDWEVVPPEEGAESLRDPLWRHDSLPQQAVNAHRP